MKKEQLETLYDDYIVKLKEALEKEDFDALDDIVEHATNLTEEEYEEITDIIDEATLYIEFKDDEYKDEALKMIENMEEVIG